MRERDNRNYTFLLERSPERAVRNRLLPSRCVLSRHLAYAAVSPSRQSGRDRSLEFRCYLAASQFCTKVFAVQRASSDFPVHQSIGLTHRAEYKRARCIPTYPHTRARNARHIHGLRVRGPLQGDAKFCYFYSGLSHRDARTT